MKLFTSYQNTQQEDDRIYKRQVVAFLVLTFTLVVLLSLQAYVIVKGGKA